MLQAKELEEKALLHSEQMTQKEKELMEQAETIEKKKYNEEELIYDIKENKKIDIDFFIKKYLSEKELYMLSKLNNKLIVQKNENIQLFSFKNENDVTRFVDSLTNSMDKINFIYVSDVSSAQKKYLYKLLEESGFDKQMLYRKSTTHPKQR